MPEQVQTSDLAHRWRIGRSLTRPVGRSLLQRVSGLVWAWLLASLLLALTFWLVPGLTVASWWTVMIATALVAIVGWLLRPFLDALALSLGWVGVIIIAVFAQAIVMSVALALTPGVSWSAWWEVLLAAWVFAIFTAVVGFLDETNEDEIFLAHVVRAALRRNRGRPVLDVDQHGVVFVQMDGVPQPLLEWALLAGNLPTINRWLRTGTHTVTGWTARVPSTTPVSQAGILLGSNDDMPAFRWFEKATSGPDGHPGRLIVANHPPDAALIEQRLSDGRGLLADDGWSVGNMFTGDAVGSALTMSAVGAQGKGAVGDSGDFGAFFATPYGFTRALVLTVAEMVKEVAQARRAIQRGIEPRVPRHGAYIALRGVTNVFMRDLNLALVAEQMIRGRKSIYVDFLDYDEIAHHAGVARPESLAAMSGVDGVLGMLEEVAKHSPRRYHIVVVSDHGQSQGATFKQRHGQSLEEYVRRLMGGDVTVAAATGHDEDWGPLNTFLGQLRNQASVTGRVSNAVLKSRTGPSGAVALGPHTDAEGATESAEADVVVCGSGNLGLVWFSQVPGRMTLEDIDQRWPGLVRSLATNPYIGFVVALSAADGVVALGPGGVHRLETGEVDGVDPLADFGPHAPADMLRCARFHNAPDLYLNSFLDPETGEVAAFEELVGCHGGLGGWQTNPILVHPKGWVVDEPIVGADRLHAQLVRWLEHLGHRRSLSPAEAVRSAE